MRGPADVNEPLATARQTADRLGISAGALLRWARAGKVPSVKLPSGAVRFRPEAIEAWLEHDCSRAGGATRGVSPATDATRRREVSFSSSPALRVDLAARTEENLDAR
jgi:excisionase family DNA binding protein